MIPKDHITAWRAYAPWAIDAQVEQDLVISRALVEMFCVPELVSRLLLRGGTARSSPNFPVKSPYGSPGSVKLLVPPTCFWGGTRFEVPRFS